MKRQPMFSLRKSVLRILVIGMAALLLLAGALLVFTMSQYHRQVEEHDMDLLQSANGELSRAYDNMRRAVNAIYSTGAFFEGSLADQGGAENTTRIYNTLNMLKLQMQTSGNIGGLMMVYSDLKPVLYHMDSSISYRDQELLNTLGRDLGVDSFSVDSMVVEGADSDYYFLSMQKPSAKICGFVSLGSVLPSGSDHAHWGYVSGGSFHWIPGYGVEGLEIDAGRLTVGLNRLWDYTAYIQGSLASGVTLVRVVDESWRRWVNGQHIAIAAAILLLLVLFVLVRRFAIRELSVPLEDMRATMTQLQGGQWDADFQAPNRIQEIEDVRQAVNTMLKGIEQYKNQAYEEQMERQRTQLQYAQLQLAPHFYTNCLKNAYYMLELKQYDTLEQFLLCLSTHLRYLLVPDRNFVTLREEKAFVENYVELQRQLTQREIVCEIHIGKADLDLQIPILALQTFVENSVKYAMRSGRDRLNIWLKVTRLRGEDGEALNISYADRGGGYPPEVLDMLNNRVPADREGLGVGIVNLLKRCRFHYGDAASWGFYNDDGAVSELILPIDHSGGEDLA